MKVFKKEFKDFFEHFFKNIPSKAITKTIKKQESVAHVISFAPTHGIKLKTQPLC
jgi:hypothetical protein